MFGAVMHAAGDVRVEERPDPRIEQRTDVVMRVTAACVCGSDLWWYRGANRITDPVPMGHEYVGVVEEVGADVRTVQVGDAVVGSFFASCGVCELCRDGWQSHCVNAVPMGALGTQAERLRVPWADGTLVVVPGGITPENEASLLAASDVFGTGWFAADAAAAGPGKTTVVVGDGAVGLLGILSARERGAERIIAMSRNPARQKLAREFGATDIVEERGDEGVARVKDMTGGLGAPSVIEAVGTQESLTQAIRSTRAGGHLGFVGVAHGVKLPGGMLFGAQIHMLGGGAPVRRYLPDLVDRILRGSVAPGRVFDLELPLRDAAEAYRAMDERRAVKVLLRP